MGIGSIKNRGVILQNIFKLYVKYDFDFLLLNKYTLISLKNVNKRMFELT